MSLDWAVIASALGQMIGYAAVLAAFLYHWTMEMAGRIIRFLVAYSSYFVLMAASEAGQ